MPLVSATMKTKFLRLFTPSGFPANPDKAATELSGIYNQYAQSATAGGTLPSFTGGEVERLKSALFPVLRSPRTSTAPKMARAWASGLSRFWLSPAVQFAGGSGTGVVTLFPGQPSLISALTVIFQNNRNSAGRAASTIASALHTATLTVTVLITPPTGTPFPVKLT